MNVPNRERERRDWSLVIFIIPLGILLIIIVGQLAIRLFPNWTINADMRSNLDPNTAPGQPASLLQPLLPHILTQMAWADTYLTPNGDVSFPPFIILEPTGTPLPTSISPNPSTPTPSPTATTPSPTFTVTASVTPTGGSGGGGTPTPITPSTTCQNPAATNFGGSLPCTFPPTTCQDPLATNFGGPLPCMYPPTTCQDPLATNFGGLLPCTYPPTPNPSTPHPSWVLVAAPPEIGLSNPDGNVGSIPNGSYIVINLNGNPIIVSLTPDNYYDLVFYESVYSPGFVQLDQIIIGISNDNGNTYYEVFNWYDNIPDTNTNADTSVLPPDPSPACVELECDNREIPIENLYPYPGTGILIDVDTATSAPPAGQYDWIVIVSPIGGSGDTSQVDAIVVTEVPIP